MRLNARRCVVQRGLLSKIGASHEGEFFFHMIEQPVAFFYTESIRRCFPSIALFTADEAALKAVFYAQRFRLIISKHDGIWRGWNAPSP